ncbi:la-related protein Larp4B-like [Vespula squamosa]|uniref:La-related protein Larp4B-like n=1 Tax=Vespula squamosa TaxID=30214 RepID=A0ABD1ZVE8_VESSQ
MIKRRGVITGNKCFVARKSVIALCVARYRLARLPRVRRGCKEAGRRGGDRGFSKHNTSWSIGTKKERSNARCSRLLLETCSEVARDSRDSPVFRFDVRNRHKVYSKKLPERTVSEYFQAVSFRGAMGYCLYKDTWPRKSIRCTVTGCTCESFTPGKRHLRYCGKCHHGWDTTVVMVVKGTTWLRTVTGLKRNICASICGARSGRGSWKLKEEEKERALRPRKTSNFGPGLTGALMCIRGLLDLRFDLAQCYLSMFASDSEWVSSCKEEEEEEDEEVEEKEEGKRQRRPFCPSFLTSFGSEDKEREL